MAHTILCQSAFCHLALRTDDHLKPFEHEICKGGEEGGVRVSQAFFQPPLQIIAIYSTVSILKGLTLTNHFKNRFIKK